MRVEEQLARLKPARREVVFDVVKDLGFDVTDWIASASNPGKLKANPKYCYDWSFVQPGVIAIFNLWHDAMKIENGQIVYRDNFRANAAFHRRNGGKTKWILRGEKLDRDAATAACDALPVRVLIVDGKRRATNDPNSESSRVDLRQLDPSPWHVGHYDSATGDCLFVRGAGNPTYIDQFDVRDAGSDEPGRIDRSGQGFKRDREVRRQVLARAAGVCEWCEEKGFVMHNGAIYLETHHVIPLGEGGSDKTTNVVALCPNDHRRAHFAKNRGDMRERLLSIASR